MIIQKHSIKKMSDKNVPFNPPYPLDTKPFFFFFLFLKSTKKKPQLM